MAKLTARRQSVGSTLPLASWTTSAGMQAANPSEGENYSRSAVSPNRVF